MLGRLTLRRTEIPGAGPDDYAVWLDGKEIVGRIYRAPNRVPAAWFWGLNTFPSSAADSGFADDLEGAKARLKARWEHITLDVAGISRPRREILFRGGAVFGSKQSRKAGQLKFCIA